MGLFDLNKKNKFENYEFNFFDKIFLNLHNIIKKDFKFDGRDSYFQEEKFGSHDIIEYSYVLKNGDKIHFSCSKFYFKNYDSWFSASVYLKENFDFPVRNDEYPLTVYKIESYKNLKKFKNFYFKFEAKINEYDEKTVLFSDKLIAFVNRECVKLIKKTF